ncbi:MAG TPA: hypothetical protein VNS08_17230, partial [Ureibacillus sp.]|nr:hypothetical protein [Ureibacillus sp.]
QLEEQKPTDEELQLESETVLTEQETLQDIDQQLILLNETILAMQEEMPKEKIVVEGFFYVGLSVVIALGVYMFWNQLSKW